MKNKSGFTLIELLVVIAIIGLLSAIVIASLAGAKRKAQYAQVLTEVNEIQDDLALYYSAHGHYPLCEYFGGDNNPDTFQKICCVGSDSCAISTAGQITGHMYDDPNGIKFTSSNMPVFPNGAFGYVYYCQKPVFDNSYQGGPELNSKYVWCDTDAGNPATITYSTPNGPVSVAIGEKGQMVSSSSSGCTDSNAYNFSTNATTDDGSCRYVRILSFDGGSVEWSAKYDNTVTFYIDDTSVGSYSAAGSFWLPSVFNNNGNVYLNLTPGQHVFKACMTYNGATNCDQVNFMYPNDV